MALTANLFVIILGLIVINLKSVGIYNQHVVLYWSWGWTCEPQTMKTPHIRNDRSNLHKLVGQKQVASCITLKAGFSPTFIGGELGTSGLSRNCIFPVPSSFATPYDVSSWLMHEIWKNQ